MLLRLMKTGATAATGVWFGGLIVIAIVAQTTFQVMRNTQVEHPNTIAGQVMARNFARFDGVQLTCALILAAWQAASLVAGHRTRRDLVRTVLIFTAIVVLTINVFVMTPKIAQFQPMQSTPDTEAAVKQTFDEFHRTAVRLSQATLVLVLAILLEMAWPPKENRR